MHGELEKKSYFTSKDPGPSFQKALKDGLGATGCCSDLCEEFAAGPGEVSGRPCC